MSIDPTKLDAYVLGGGTPARPVASPKRPGGDFARLLADEQQGGTKAPGPARPRAAREETEPVPGHAYTEIIAGPRNGMFLNTSGNSRDGEAFLRVERGDFYYHIYGSGKDRTIIRMPRE